MVIHNNPIFYAIIPSEFVDSVNYEQTLCKRIGVRFSLDKTKCIVKWIGESIPLSISAINGIEGPYTQIEISQIILSNEWEEDS